MEKILILGTSGTGKTTSLRNLDPRKTMILQGRKKRLPFKNDKLYIQGKNRFVVKNNGSLLDILIKLEKSKKENITIIVDDWNYLMTSEYMAARNITGFGKFETMAFNLIDVLDFVDSMTTKGTIIFMAHTQKDHDGELEFKSVGKFVSEKFCLEGCFETVLLANPDYTMTTNGVIPAKSPMEMFEDAEVENDLAVIMETYDKFYNGEEEIEVEEDEK